MKIALKQERLYRSPETSWCRTGQFHPDARIMRHTDPCQVTKRGDKALGREETLVYATLDTLRIDTMWNGSSMLALSNMKLVHHINHQKECWCSQHNWGWKVIWNSKLLCESQMFHDEYFQTKEPKPFQVGAMKSLIGGWKTLSLRLCR